ncbi:hypothetical protein [Caulobacter hibisci]|uniref:Universal stress protein n=1 Tax=Caulobacter hibisci TaxID=2035993 RepID=A0ABS0T595_9CAUL|nr:hypothetical protein [Caulobacter hibisci]MBI1687055.1 hypothetical protein [Caulobacter hibisci]
MTQITRVMIPLDSQADETFSYALSYAKAIAEKAKTNDVILLTHTKSQLDGSTGLSRMIGPGAAKALNKGQTASLPWGASLRYETMKTLRYSARGAVIIAYYAEEKMLDFVDGLHDVGGVVAVPWVPGEADGWAARWTAMVHGAKAAAPAPLIDDPVVVRALEGLTSIINLSTGLSHPRDKERANEYLRILRAKGHADPSSTIKSWAIRHGWSPRGAADLETLARKIWSLKTKPSLSAFHEPAARYARWKTGS